MNQSDLVWQAEIADLVQQLLMTADITSSGLEPEPQELDTLERLVKQVGRANTRYHLHKLLTAAIPIALAAADETEPEDQHIDVYLEIRERFV